MVRSITEHRTVRPSTFRHTMSSRRFIRTLPRSCRPSPPRQRSTRGVRIPGSNTTCTAFIPDTIISTFPPRTTRRPSINTRPPTCTDRTCRNAVSRVVGPGRKTRPRRKCPRRNRRCTTRSDRRNRRVGRTNRKRLRRLRAPPPNSSYRTFQTICRSNTTRKTVTSRPNTAARI